MAHNFDKLPKDLQPEQLMPLIEKYSKHLEDADEKISVKNKQLATALKEQASYPIFFSQKKAELEKLCKRLNAHVEAVRGRLFKQFTENYSRELSDRAKDKYIDKEDEYLKMYELYLEVKELYDQYSNVLEAFQLRGFALRDITQATIHKIENGML